MNQSLAPSADVVFRDALGERRRMIDSTGAEAELLCLASELTAVAAFEPALRSSAGRLAAFRHPSFPALRGIERFDAATLAVISDASHGVRLSRLLATVGERGSALDLSAAFCLLRQLLGALDALHTFDRDIAHGVLGPERVVITSRARVIVTDYTLGSALEQLRYSNQHYWKSLRIAVPRSAGMTRFDQRVDLMQLGTVALALILGRVLKDDEYSAKLVDLVNSAHATGSGGDVEPLKPALRAWLLRSLQFDQHHSFTSAAEAGAMLDAIISDDDRVEGMASLERVLQQHHGLAPAALPVAIEAPVPVAPPAAAAPPVEPLVSVVQPRPSAVAPAPISPPLPLVAPQAMPPRASKPARPSQWPRVAAAAVLLAALAGGTVFAVRRRASAGTPAFGTVTVQSNPSGAQLDIDGRPAGVTPATLTLPEGTHTIVLRGAGAPRTTSIAVSAGAQISQYIELAKSAPTTGGLQVRTEPPGALVSVDHVSQGTSPATISGLAPGDHTVVVSADGASVEQTVTVEPGVLASLVVPLAARDRALLSGWVAVTAPIDVQIFENGRLLGTNQTERLMVSSGDHHFEFVNDAFGYRVARTVPVGPGKVEAVALKMPMGSLALNAVPWAEVWLDGEKVGETPIGNLQTTIGRHDVVFRHPELGDARQNVTVTLLAPARISVDLRKK